MQAASKDQDLLSLYQQIILDHGKSPRNAGVLEHYDCSSDGKNPLCGDKVTVTAALDDHGTINQIRFDAKGCAISIASASMMTEAVQNLTTDQAKALFEAVRALCSGSDSPDMVMAELGEDLGRKLEPLVALSGVRQFPTRAKCATLAWTTLLGCLESKTAMSAQE